MSAGRDEGRASDREGQTAGLAAELRLANEQLLLSGLAAAERAAEAAEQRTRLILERITDAFLALDRDWRFTYVNKRAAELVQHSAEELIGRIIWHLFPDLVGSTFDQAYHRAMATQRAAQFEAYHPGSRRWLDVHAYPSPEGLSVYLQDISERKAAEHEREQLLADLRDANQRLAVAGVQQQALAEQAERRAAEAEAAAHARDEFLSLAAHELKTPITSLRGFAQANLRRLEREPALHPERVRRALQVIDQQADRLASLVDQLLDVAGLEAGQLALDRQEIDLAQLLCEAVARAQAVTRRHHLVLHAPPALPAWVDPARLQRVVGNLLDNARKFSPEDAPIEIDLARPGAGWAQLAVRDRGPGIPPERRAQLFSRYYQVQAQAEAGRPFAGLGLGLYLARCIVEAHGGRIEAGFPPDGGSRFVITLPTRPAAGSAQPHV